ncbi:MAG TPA: tetraacyldisaccharide 4'-kinase [Pyrinomonadaceae bacterium]|nr:tetraacyldisaccharide 4'-kinase [Pyrinomonadaceae bacterium]
MYLSPVLMLLSLVYGAVTRARAALYKAGALGTHNVGVPVISVGNITTGGTGKTPVVTSIARVLARDGRRVCILSRGYGRTDPKSRVVVSDGERLFADAREGGDEPRLLAEILLGVAAVVSDADRVAAARWAVQNLNSDAFILDDGFQHLRIARDLNIVTLDGIAPWGHRKLLPRGFLRESPRSLARADCIIITRAEQTPNLDALRAEARRLSNGRASVLSCRTRTSGVRPLSSSAFDDTPAGKLLPQPVIAFCALGNPRAFFAHIRRDGYQAIHTQAFPDHHVYTQSDVDLLARAGAKHGVQTLLTTAKDAVKLRSLRFDVPCYVLDVDLEFDDECALLELVRHSMSASQTSVEK